MKKVLVTYIPVLHKGYLNLFKKLSDQISTLYIVGDELASQVSKSQEIRKVKSQDVLKMVNSLSFKFSTKILNQNNISKLKLNHVIATSDFVTKQVFKKYIPTIKPVFETQFLRWDENSVKAPFVPNHDLVTSDSFHIKMMNKAKQTGSKSSDWWRRVGCLVVKNKKIIISSLNEHFPTENTQYIEGDPRDFVKSGTLGFLSSSAHAEQMAIAQASKKGINLNGADMYVSTYPCPTCAKLMGTAGIKRCFFQGSNAYLDVEIVLKTSGVKSILVQENN